MKTTRRLWLLTTVIATIGIAALFMAGCDNGTCSHEWEWVVTRAPTEWGDGERTERCAKCAETNGTESVLATGLVRIPGGTFTMGPDIWNNNATFEVTLSAFKMGKYPVTQEQYEAVMGTNPSSFNADPAEGEVQGKRPVEMVTWFDAVEFCNKLSEREGLVPVYTIEGRTPATGYPITDATVTANWAANGYRLPTDAQWEYACRAGSTTDWHFGDEESELVHYAWYRENSSDDGTTANLKTREVGKKLPNAFGLYDMHGNVWEWCWDWWGDYPAEAQTDYTGLSSGSYRVLRGGSWFSNASILRSADRGVNTPDGRYRDIGVRLVRP